MKLSEVVSASGAAAASFLPKPKARPDVLGVGSGALVASPKGGRGGAVNLMVEAATGGVPTRAWLTLEPKLKVVCLGRVN